MDPDGGRRAIRESPAALAAGYKSIPRVDLRQQQQQHIILIYTILIYAILIYTILIYIILIYTILIYAILIYTILIYAIYAIGRWPRLRCLFGRRLERRKSKFSRNSEWWLGHPEETQISMKFRENVSHPNFEKKFAKDPLKASHSIRRRRQFPGCVLRVPAA